MHERPSRMTYAHRSAAVGLVAALVGGGCTDKPPPKPPPATAPAPAPKPPAPAAPPSPCESLAEKCQATADTAARVPGTDLVFTPPEGWLYAQEEEVTLAQTPDGGPCLAMASFEKVGKVDAERAEVVDRIIRSVGIKLPDPPKGKPLIDWTTADAEQDIAGFKMGMWQREGAARAAINGPLLMFTFDTGETARVIGLGFAPKDDPAQSDKKILKAIESLRPAPAPAEGAEEKESDAS